ncbi:MAG: hypothetical protein BRD40_04150 [Bacteroidetes bacterium QS_1_65_9]|jgi:predicted DNA-binding transcriptional regulator YafY|nr:MAG: hypothetical protein BRD40_04150 [Bacteroidetes bacterium QS_1_65_9]
MSLAAFPFIVNPLARKAHKKRAPVNSANNLNSSSLAHFYEALSKGERLTQQEVAEWLGVSARQVRRLASSLREEGVPLQESFEDRRRVYYLEPGDRHADTVSLDLPERELLALTVATRAAGPTLSPTPLSEPLTSASASLEGALRGKVFSFIPAFETERWHFSRATSVDLDPEMFWALKQAIADRHPVRIDYYSAYRDAWSRDRKIDPLLFAVRRGAWLCVAYCHKRRKVLDFNLVDIEDVTIVSDEHFEPPSNFDRDTYFEGRFGALTGDSAHAVRFRVSEDMKRYFRRKVYHPTQQIEPAGSGIDVTFRVRGLEEIASFVLSWGTGVEVLEPEALRKRIADEVQALAEQYQ